MPQVDLNCDLGEGFGAWSMGDDAALLEIISSANIACGFHAGDPQHMMQTVAKAAANRVSIGAHVSYPDRVGFGRRAMQLTANEVTTDVLYQMGALQAICQANGTRVRYVKPHGALYHRIMVDEDQAKAVVQAIQYYDAKLPLVVMPNSVAQRVAARAGIKTIAEAFADRAYTNEARLVARTEPGAVISDSGEIVARMRRLVEHQQLLSQKGKQLTLVAQTLCVHGDTPAAVRLAGELRDALEQAGVSITPFVQQ